MAHGWAARRGGARRTWAGRDAGCRKLKHRISKSDVLTFQTNVLVSRLAGKWSTQLWGKLC